MYIETGVSIIMNRWLEVDRDELILFVTDETHTREADAVDRWARSSDAVVKTIILDADDVQEGTVIQDLEEQFCRANAIIGATDNSFITAPAVKTATSKGVRFLSLPLSCSDGTSLLENDFIAMDCRWAAKMGKKLLKNLRKAKSVHITTELGTDITFRIEGRKPGLYNGMTNKAGQVSSSSFEVYVAPIENATEGTLILDGSLGYIGTVEKPIHIEFHDGRLHILDDHYDAVRLKEYIESFGDDTMWINGELGIGLNALSKCRGVSYIEDESTYGTFHIGMGRNITLGGQQQAAGHFDIVTHRPTIWADDICIMRDGIIV
ncbi:MAG: aminopeptidase [Oscillospiraceae bacterium]|nr:aminopeptidase [Oscillospiraceae bacterium]MDO5138365.1 aminopeptidase [Oscillospiraceae bacterium]